MGVNTFKQPNAGNTGAGAGTAYKDAIDSSIAVMARIAGPFAVHQKEPTADMTVIIDSGPLFVSDSLPTEKAQQTSNALTAPTTDKRNDIVYIDNTTGNYGIVTGVENSSPADPSIPANSFSVARIRWEVGATEITNSDIDDLRAGLMYGASTGLQQQIDALRTHDVLQDFREKVNNANTFSLNPLGFTDELNDKEALQNGAAPIQMVKFDSTANYIKLAGAPQPAGGVDGKELMVNFLFRKRSASGITGTFMDGGQGGNPGFLFGYGTDDKLFVQLYDDTVTPVKVGDVKFSTAMVTGSLYNILLYVNTAESTAADRVKCVVNGVKETEAITTQVALDDVLNFGEGSGSAPAWQDMWIGRGSTGSQLSAGGDIGQLWWSNEALDPDIAVNLALFMDSDGNPNDLGSAGENVTGNEPVFFYNNPVASWETDLTANNNDATIVGGLADAGLETTGASDLSYNATDDTVTNAHGIIDSYGKENIDTNIQLSSADNHRAGQAVTNTNAQPLKKLAFVLQKSGLPTGNAYAEVHTVSGTVGSTGVGTNEILARSEPLDVSTLTTSNTVIDFDFPESPMLDAATDYFYCVYYDGGDASNDIRVARDFTTGTHSGNQASHDGSTWTAEATHDIIFYAYGLKPFNLTTKTSDELGNSPAVVPTTANVHLLVQETPASMSNDWSDTLNADNTGFANYTGRQRVTPVASGDEWQLRFEGHSTNPTTLDNVSIMKELGNFNGVGDITNILFGGQASITIPAGGSVLCDKFKKTMVAGVAHLVAMDFSSDTGADDFRWVITGGEGFAYKAASNSYNTLTMPSGFTEAATHTAIINLLKVGVEQTLGTDIELKVSSDGGATMDEVSAYSRDKVTVAGTTYNLLSGPVTLTGGGTNMMAEITGPGGHKITGKAYDIAWEKA